MHAYNMQQFDFFVPASTFTVPHYVTKRQYLPFTIGCVSHPHEYYWTSHKSESPLRFHYRYYLYTQQITYIMFDFSNDFSNDLINVTIKFHKAQICSNYSIAVGLRRYDVTNNTQNGISPFNRNSEFQIFCGIVLSKKRSSNISEFESLAKIF